MLTQGMFQVMYSVLISDMLSIIASIIALVGTLITLVLSTNARAEMIYKEVNDLLLKVGHNSNDMISNAATPFNLIIKRMFDIVFSIISLLLIIPYLIPIMIILRITVKAPIIIKNKRIGLRGKPFYAYKFNTMEIDITDNKHKSTKFGRFLEKTSMDEFPKLFNVLKGDMSLVGLSPYREKDYLSLPEYQQSIISSHKPGITTLWTISLSKQRAEINKQVDFDIYYVNNFSLMFDYKILYKTFYLALSKPGEY